MGYYTGTKVRCTKPELLFTGSTFNNEWNDFIISIEGGVTCYYCRKNYFNDALSELSRSNPEVTFSGCTWIDDDYYDAINYSFILENGEYEYVDMAPHYKILFPVIEDEEYNTLKYRFHNQIDAYLKRIDIVRKNMEEGVVFDFLNDKKDKDGFVSYYTITWENENHIFTATKRFTSHVIIDYQRKTTRDLDELDLDCIKSYDINEHYNDAGDFGDYDCLTEDDLFKDTWLVAGMKFSNHIDYFWEAEITNLCQTPAGNFYKELRDGLSDPESGNYSKYMCYQGDSGFYYCNKECCEECTNICTEKILNEQYVLWEKYVQPIELNENYGPKA